MKLESFAQGRWVAGKDGAEVRSAVTGEVVAQATGGGLDMQRCSLTRATLAATNSAADLSPARRLAEKARVIS